MGNGGGEKKSGPLGTALEEITKDVVAIDMHLQYVYQKDKPFDGELKLSGQLGRKGMCYFMLELAAHFIHDFDPAKQQGAGIVLAKGFPGVPGARG